ncbi:MAG TPA: cytochrome ubiquinol oxidase subunit I [Burkholderiaceae bacterium]|nr:cytochrome ubiquinol oxidase subunit I [Burkholderiaceae bacterium]
MHLETALDLSRLQFAFTAIFHILWPILTISLSLFVFLLEALWARTGDPQYGQHTRYWSKLLALNFAVGVVSGIPMEFEFGTNWAPFSQFGGEFFGNILGFEGAMAFMLEAGFVGVMLYGWNRVPRAVHLFATGMVALGSSLSAFWIMVANSWMQTPAGVEASGGRLVVTDYLAAIFNPSMASSALHMWTASIETGLFVVAGLSAWKMLRRQQPEFFARSFKLACALLLVVSPLQLLIGDWSGQNVFEHQPAKGAAIEGHWQTNAPGTGASWSLLAWPDKARQRNTWSLEVPAALSLLATHSATGTVRGLSEFAPEDQPPMLPLLYYAFRLMAGIGMWFVVLAAWTAWVWRRARWRSDALLRHPWLLRAWVLTIPLPYLAVECGWIVREVGRQPWAIYGLLRTHDAATTLSSATVTSSLWMFAACYLVLLAAFTHFARRWLLRGPDQHASARSRAAAALSHRPVPLGDH